MRNPKIVLDNLTKQAKKSNYYFDRLYRNLYNPKFYYMAYNSIKTGETKGDCSCTNMPKWLEKDKLDKLIESIKNQSYQPKDIKKIRLNSKTRVNLVEDNIVQEIIRSLLESIYDIEFSANSHAYRTNKSAHTALSHIMRDNGVTWFINGDIDRIFEKIDFQILISILRKKIKDERLINLIWKFLKNGYMTSLQNQDTYSGIHEAGILSSMLINIYLNEFDMYMEEYIKKFNIGKKSKKRNPRYRHLEYQISKLKKSIKEGRVYINKQWVEVDDDMRNTILREIKELKKTLTATPSVDPMDPSFKRMTYTRYADKFLIGIIGDKSDCTTIVEDINRFLVKELSLQLSEDDERISNSRNFVRFLGYDITVSRSQKTKKIETRNTRETVKKRTENGKVKLYVPHEIWVSKLKDYDALKIIMQEGKEKWIPTHRRYLKDYDDLEIVSVFNREIKGFYEYYRLANNASVLNKFYYIMRYSFVKTLGCKYKTSMSKIMKRFKVNGNLGVRFNSRNGKQVCLFYKDGFKRNIKASNSFKIDRHPSTIMFGRRNSLIERLNVVRCEICGREAGMLEIHHIKKLKDIKDKKVWEKNMIARKRKTEILCLECHSKLHAGKLDGR